MFQNTNMKHASILFKRKVWKKKFEQKEKNRKKMKALCFHFLTPMANIGAKEAASPAAS